LNQLFGSGACYQLAREVPVPALVVTNSHHIKMEWPDYSNLNNAVMAIPQEGALFLSQVGFNPMKTSY